MISKSVIGDLLLIFLALFLPIVGAAMWAFFELGGYGHGHKILAFYVAAYFLIVYVVFSPFDQWKRLILHLAGLVPLFSVLLFLIVTGQWSEADGLVMLTAFLWALHYPGEWLSEKLVKYLCPKTE